MKKIILVVLLGVFLNACSTMQPPRYSVSVDNIQELKKHNGAKAIVASFNQVVQFDASCRLMGPIEPADGLTISQFIAKAINDEFKMADVYSSAGTKITGTVTKIQFSSISGLTNGFWDIGLRLISSNGVSLDVTNKYNFKSGFDAITACNATADALSPAVQDIIGKLIKHPDFGMLLK